MEVSFRLSSKILTDYLGVLLTTAEAMSKILNPIFAKRQD